MPRSTPIPMPVELPPSPSETPQPPEDQKAKPYAVHLRLALGPWTVHFNSPGYIKEETMQMLETSVVRKTIERTKKSAEVREELGTDSAIWKELGQLVDAAVPSLEKRCFSPPSPQDPDYEVLSGTLIAHNYHSLLKDLERLHSIVLIARNILIVGERAQSLCAKAEFDQEMFRLINVCVKVAARGYDGEPGNPDQKKFDTVVDSFKHLLICSLQFLNNLTSRNERRKLMLWVELFDGGPEPITAMDQSSVDSVTKANPSDLAAKLEEDLRYTLLDSTKGLLDSSEDTWLGKGSQQPASSPFLLFIGKTGMEVKRQLIERGEKAGAAEIAAECKRRWQSMSEDEKREWDDFYKDLIERYREGLAGSLPPTDGNEEAGNTAGNVAALARSINQLRIEVEKMRKSILAASKAPQESSHSRDHQTLEKKPSTFKELESVLPTGSKLPDPPSPKESDFYMEYTASYGADILQQGKDDLMKRLQSYSEQAPPATSQVVSPNSPLGSPTSPGTAHPDDVLEDGSEEEDDSEDDDYVVPGDDGRGLLTDVPLILAPGEIEVLPMIIMSGVVPPDEGMPGYGSTPDEVVAIRNMHTVRCHLLLAHENGRNLLRELLIFVAAWDLREEELYFKMMVKIMEAILINALMPFSYHAFRESKDIISPAQAVIMKLLTNIFRVRQADAIAHRPSEEDADLPPNPFPLQVHVQMVKFLFTEFRRHIIPQTCALIFLQGQIRAGHASPEDFPLNLWDMERMYEGVYQYLEFFAILTEHELWKKMMADWDITSEMVTLLKELDAAIPKGQLPGIPPIRTDPSTADQIRRSTEAAAAVNYDPQGANPQSLPPVAVERPYDVTGQTAAGDSGASPSIPATNPLPPGAFMNDVGGFGAESPADEPSDFEWRNLKKLAVLVLSSLVWKSRTVQDQVRNHGGIDAILNCCAHDEHNPYIREHAIMCLRFLLEGNQENQDVIRQLEPRGVVPSEVLDQHGYETFMDAKGHVGLRRKEVLRSTQAPPPTLPPIPPSTSGPSHKITPKDPKDLADLVQSMMKDLPAMKERLKMDPVSLAELAKLDKKFEQFVGSSK